MRKRISGLDRVGVLEFVDEDVTIPLPERAADRIVLAHERARPLEEIVEVEDGGGAFEGGVVGEHLIELIGKFGDQRGRDAAEDHPIAVIDAGKVTTGLLVELGAAILAGDLVPRRLRPWGQQIERVRAHARQARRMSEPPERVEDRRRRETGGEVIRPASRAVRSGRGSWAPRAAPRASGGNPPRPRRDRCPAGRSDRPRARRAPRCCQAKPRELPQGGGHVMRIVLRQGGDRIVGPRRSV